MYTGITFVALRALCTGIAFVALRALRTGIAFVTLRTLCTGITFVTLRALCTGITFVTLRALYTGITFVALRALHASIAFVALRALYTGITFVTLRALRTGITFIALRALRTGITFWAFKSRVILQSIFIQRDKDSFISIIANFLCLETIAKVKLKIADCHIICNRSTCRIDCSAAVDMNRHIHDILQLSHIDSICIIKACSQIRDLAGVFIITDGNSSPRRFPCFIVEITSGLCQNVISRLFIIN